MEKSEESTVAVALQGDTGCLARCRFGFVVLRTLTLFSWVCGTGGAQEVRGRNPISRSHELPSSLLGRGSLCDGVDQAGTPQELLQSCLSFRAADNTQETCLGYPTLASPCMKDSSVHRVLWNGSSVLL